jgi:alpha-galactosidase/6-phospho-beta-glucosidase family protein
MWLCLSRSTSTYLRHVAVVEGLNHNHFVTRVDKRLEKSKKALRRAYDKSRRRGRESFISSGETGK